MVTFIAQKPSFKEKKICKTPADFGQISGSGREFEFGQAGDPVDHCTLCNSVIYYIIS